MEPGGEHGSTAGGFGRDHVAAVQACGLSGDGQSQAAAATAVRIAGEVTPGDLVEVRQDADRGVLVFDVVTKDADGVLTLTQVAANTGEVLKAEQLLAEGRVPSEGGEVQGR